MDMLSTQSLYGSTQVATQLQVAAHGSGLSAKQKPAWHQVHKAEPAVARPVLKPRQSTHNLHALLSPLVKCYGLAAYINLDPWEIRSDHCLGVITDTEPGAPQLLSIKPNLDHSYILILWDQKPKAGQPGATILPKLCVLEQQSKADLVKQFVEQ